MGEKDSGAVITVIIVEGKTVDDAVQRRHDLCSRGSPDIDAKMKPAGFGALVEMFTPGIEGPVLAIAADAVAGLVLLQCPVDPGGEAIGIGDIIRRKMGIVCCKIEGV